MEWKELLSLAGNRSCALLSLSLSPLSQKQWKAFGASLVLSSPLSLVNLNWNCATFRDCWSYKKFPSKTDISREECQFEERASFGPVLVNGLGRFMILGLNERQDTNVGDWLGTVTVECTPFLLRSLCSVH
ncbi:UNVERIFIED_CONTAM: hypothetical protein Sradi_6843100 [Sesamum radiatum]|uniref:Uncharacterized protein n=2 Tax=Sesamum TaxID=4181 RepID=A0AAW2IQD4_SESRA